MSSWARLWWFVVVLLVVVAVDSAVTISWGLVAPVWRLSKYAPSQSAVRTPSVTSPPVTTAAVTGTSTHVFLLTAPNDAAEGPHTVGRFAYVTPPSTHPLSVTRATVPALVL